jgi:YHS domain-containing protein
MDKPPEPEKIACAVCRREIPLAAALHAESQGYAFHFCDPACLVSWEEGLRPEPKKS